jgi:hypothetical protein
MSLEAPTDLLKMLSEILLRRYYFTIPTVASRRDRILFQSLCRLVLCRALARRASACHVRVIEQLLQVFQFSVTIRLEILPIRQRHEPGLLLRHHFLKCPDDEVPVGDPLDALDALTVPFLWVQKDSMHNVAVVENGLHGARLDLREELLD